jgi:hypothetical protein
MLNSPAAIINTNFQSSIVLLFYKMIILIGNLCCKYRVEIPKIRDFFSLNLEYKL